jgi:hypothetical protein
MNIKTILGVALLSCGAFVTTKNLLSEKKEPLYIGLGLISTVIGGVLVRKNNK